VTRAAGSPTESGHTRPTAPTLTGERVTLRAVEAADVPDLRAILRDPSVARWWGAPKDGVDVADDWLDSDADTTVWTIEVAGAVAGSLQASEETDPDYRHASLDLFLGPDHQGRGLGRDALRTAARYLFDVRGHHRLTIDPSAGNERAIRAYERIGFLPVGRMRRYERGPDGTFHDGLLMDLLREELR
jgi:aminoglycoside 6'-N-acetyltransferase